MITVISPAKTLDFDSPAQTSKQSPPVFYKETLQLVRIMQKKTLPDLARMMRISPKLAALNLERFQDWRKQSRTVKQALLAFKGDVYIGLEAETYTERDLAFAQKNLRILSGLYGLLKPLDMIQPYRLEMGSKLKTRQGDTLYGYWGNRITTEIVSELQTHRNKTLVNLASQEYFKAVNPSLLPARLITPVFKDYNNGTYKVLSFFAKKARGSMATFIVKNRITRPEDIKDFAVDGYRYNDGYSSDDVWVFTRKAT